MWEDTKVTIRAAAEVLAFYHELVSVDGSIPSPYSYNEYSVFREFPLISDYISDVELLVRGISYRPSREFAWKVFIMEDKKYIAKYIRDKGLDRFETRKELIMDILGYLFLRNFLYPIKNYLMASDRQQL